MISLMMALGSWPPPLQSPCRPQPTHEHRSRRGPVYHDPEIKFALDRQGLFDQEPLHDLALRASLVRDQAHAQDLVGPVDGFVKVLGDFHAAAFASTASVDLGFHHNALSAFRKEPVSAFSASARVSAISPRGTATPYFARIVFAWYS